MYTTVVYSLLADAYNSVIFETFLFYFINPFCFRTLLWDFIFLLMIFQLCYTNILRIIKIESFNLIGNECFFQQTIPLFDYSVTALNKGPCK